MQNTADNPKGRVVALTGASDSARVLLDVDVSAACPRCAEGRGCGAGMLGQQPGRRRVEALLNSGVSVNEGDLVEIQLRPDNVLKAAIVVYGYPLIAAILASVFAWALGLHDLYAAGFVVLGLAAGLLLARRRLAGNDCLRQFTPVVVDRLPDATR